jgi:hypothetical protein
MLLHILVDGSILKEEEKRASKRTTLLFINGFYTSNERRGRRQSINTVRTRKVRRAPPVAPCRYSSLNAYLLQTAQYGVASTLSLKK